MKVKYLLASLQSHPDQADRLRRRSVVDAILAVATEMHMNHLSAVEAIEQVFPHRLAIFQEHARNLSGAAAKSALRASDL